MTAVGQKLLEDGCELQFSSSGEATAYLRRRNFSCNDIPLVDVVFTENGTFSATETMKFAPWLFVKMMKQTGIEGRNMIRFGPDVVLSDSVPATVMASKLLGLKLVTVLNQIKLISSPDTPHIAGTLLTNGSITVGNEFWEMSDRVLVPDLPPPYTISEANLWGAGTVGSRAEYVGFLVAPVTGRPDPETERILNGLKKRLIFWQVSGPPKTRAAFLPKVKAVAQALKDEYVSIVSAGNPLGSSSPQPFEGGYFYDWCPSRDALIDRSDVMVSRAGHVTISDLILRGKPCILVPIPGQSEQLGNATKADNLGVAVKVEEGEFTAQTLGNAVSILASDETRRRISDLSRLANQYDAVGSIIRAMN